MIDVELLSAFCQDLFLLLSLGLFLASSVVTLLHRKPKYCSVKHCSICFCISFVLKPTNVSVGGWKSHDLLSSTVVLAHVCERLLLLGVLVQLLPLVLHLLALLLLLHVDAEQKRKLLMMQLAFDTFQR